MTKKRLGAEYYDFRVSSSNVKILQGSLSSLILFFVVKVSYYAKHEKGELNVNNESQIKTFSAHNIFIL